MHTTTDPTPLATAQAAGTRPAGDFLHWLEQTLASFVSGHGVTVPCNTCRACCQAGYFIPVHPQEWTTLQVVPPHLLALAPGQAEHGTRLIGTTRRGDCALLRQRSCSIYEHRPQACRDYDCRVFAAAGLSSGHDPIDQQVSQWRFLHQSEASRQAQAAVRAAARFVTEHAGAFPGGQVPRRPADVAVVALKAHRVFLDPTPQSAGPTAIAHAVVQACRAFDATGQLAPDHPIAP